MNATLILSDDLKVADLDTAVLDELERLVLDIVEGWYEGTRIDWEDVWDRLDGTELADGRTLDIPSLISPVQNALKKRIHH